MSASEHSETEPLLGPHVADQATSSSSSSLEESSPKTKTPLPKLQLFIIMLIQFAEPVAATVIFPFVNQLVRDTDVIRGDERRTGYYGGIIESVFYLAECATVYHWGVLSDKKGRKPVLMIGLVILTITMVLFGFSTRYWMMIVSRTIQGACNGNIGVTKGMMSEMTDSTNQVDAFAFIPMMWATGVTVGPIIGGGLSNPATRWTLFDTALFRTYPYLLPCATAALIPFTCIFLGSLLLKETLPSLVEKENARKKAGTNTPDENGIAFPSVESETPPAKSVSFRSLVTHRRVVITVVNHCFLSFVDQCHQILVPLMYSTSIANGGLGFTPFQIGTVMGVLGFINGAFQLFFFSKLMHRLGPRRLFITAFSGFFVAIAAYPTLSYLARRAGGADMWVWIGVGVQLFCGNLMISLAYGCSFMYILNSAPNRASVGATNGLAQMLSTTMRTIAPSFASSLFSASLEGRLLGGTLVYWVLLAIASVGSYASTYQASELKGQTSD